MEVIMKIKFICGEQSIESTDFTQASLDFYLEEHLNKYNKRFTGQISILKSVSIREFLESNSDNIFIVEAYSGEDEIKVDSLSNGKLYTINKDIINDYCRIEIRYQEPKAVAVVSNVEAIK
jgi:hypothetical protein